MVDGFRGAARAQQQGLAMMGLQQGFDGLREADDVRIVAHKLHLGLALADDFDDVHGAYLGRVRVEFVQVGDDLFLVGDGES